jgi:hypothetical protein
MLPMEAIYKKQCRQIALAALKLFEGCPPFGRIF